MTLDNETWSSTVLSRPIPTTGLQLFATLKVSDTPQDSVTVKLGLPTGAITVSSGNDGPVDTPINGNGTLVISTSPLRSFVDFTSHATNTGQSGTISMTVTNAGSEQVTGIIPELGFIEGQELLTLGAANPPLLENLEAGVDTVISWNFVSESPGVVILEGNASGYVNGDQIRRSISTPTSGHRIHTPVPQLELYPTASLPFSINRGQVGLVPLSLTFVNPGGADVANAHLTALRLSLKEGPDGAGIIPNHLLDQIIVSEGTNIYLIKTELENSGQTVELVFPEPVVITGSEPVTLGIRLDLAQNPRLHLSWCPSKTPATSRVWMPSTAPECPLSSEMGISPSARGKPPWFRRPRVCWLPCLTRWTRSTHGARTNRCAGDGNPPVSVSARRQFLVHRRRAPGRQVPR